MGLDGVLNLASIVGLPGTYASDAQVKTATPAPQRSDPEPTFTPIREAAPVSIAIPAVDLAADVEEYTDAMVEASGGWVEPPHRDIVAWWSGGGAPGLPATNTVYLYGHVAASPAVFNVLVDLTIGDQIEVTTAEGTLTYAVTSILPPVLKQDLPEVPEVAEVAPGRLVLIGCYREDDQGSRPTTHNTVVIAEQIIE